MTTPTTEAPKDLIGFLDFYLVKKAPFQLPDGAKEWIVQFGPWITVVLLILTLFVVVEIGLMIAALPGLFSRKMSGWRLLFYSQLVSLAYSLLSRNIVSGLIVGLISLYILFQVRPLYHE